MKKTRRPHLLFALVLALLAIPTLVVFAKELGSLTVSGPGIKGAMTIDHEGGMRKLEETGFFDQTASVKPPENLGVGYNITAYLNLDGKVVPFVEMVYYPSDGKEPGYVHYTGRLNGESLQAVDQWCRLNKDADIAFRGLMDEYGITLQAAFTVAPAPAAQAVQPAAEAQSAAIQPVTAPAAPRASMQSSYIVLAAAVAVMLLAGAGLMIRRRTIRQSAS